MKYGNAYKVMMFFLVCVLVVSINPLVVFAAEYFVATTGNNSNSGTIKSPFRTLEKAASVMSVGDTMFIRAGTYQRTAWDLQVPSGGGSWATATTIQAYNNEQVILTPLNSAPSGTDVIRIPSGRSYIIFDGLILDGLRDGLNNGGRMGIRLSDSLSTPSHHIRLINMEIRNTFDSAVQTTNAHHNEFINSNFHHATDEGNLDRGGPYGMYIEGEYNLVMGCDIHDNQGYGIHNYSGHAYKPNYNRYIGNRFYSNGRSGIIVTTSKGVEVINNLFYGNGTGEPVGYTGDARSGIDLNYASNALIYNNTVYGNTLNAFQFGPNATNATVRNNIFYRGAGSSKTVAIHSGSTGVLTNNVIYHPTAGNRVSNAGNVTVSDNNNDDPLFLKADTHDFHLRSGSPAIGKGIVLNEVKIDFDNVQRNQPYDIGAYAFVSSSLPDTTPPASPRNVSIH